jgi:hypothetical protein
MTILGLTLFGWVHTFLSLAMLVAGFVVVKDLLASKVSHGWMAVFLLTGVATSLTGFGFPFDRLGDSHFVAIISLVVLSLSILGLYAFHFAGPWRWIFALGVAVAFYLDVFVGIAQLFKKVPTLRTMAPTLMEPPFFIVQAVVLAVFIWLFVQVTRKFQPGRPIAVQ